MATKEKKTVEPTGAPVFGIEKLRANCVTLFGVTTSTFDGATHGLEGEFTVEAMKQTIEEWKNKKISNKKEAN
ncbi:MAG: hypothetical protein IJX94_01395 [Clostridia bacterium]|nr:hypothetical protein [Clostridia bacterium]